MLKIEQEDSSVAQGTQGAVDLITNKRTDHDDGARRRRRRRRARRPDHATPRAKSENRVPILGSIPIIGELFKTRSGAKEKRNLMVFIRPTILRDGADAAIETNAKYNVRAQSAAAASQGQGHAAARRASAAAAADRRAVEVCRSDRWREGARSRERIRRKAAR